MGCGDRERARAPGTLRERAAGGGRAEPVATRGGATAPGGGEPLRDRWELPASPRRRRGPRRLGTGGAALPGARKHVRPPARRVRRRRARRRRRIGRPAPAHARRPRQRAARARLARRLRAGGTRAPRASIRRPGPQGAVRPPGARSAGRRGAGRAPAPALGGDHARRPGGRRDGPCGWRGDGGARREPARPADPRPRRDRRRDARRFPLAAADDERAPRRAEAAALGAIAMAAGMRHDADAELLDRLDHLPPLALAPLVVGREIAARAR
jgi:hypothetical protein